MTSAWPVPPVARRGLRGRVDEHPAGFVLQQQAVDDVADHAALVGVEALGGLEVQAEVVTGAALAVLEEQGVGWDAEGDGELAQDLEGGQGGPALGRRRRRRRLASRPRKPRQALGERRELRPGGVGVSTQFLTRDPLTSVTREPYGYTSDNPLNGTDPLGLWPWDDLCLRNPFGGNNDNGGCHTTLSTSQGVAGVVAGGAAACALVTVGICGAVGLTAPHVEDEVAGDLALQSLKMPVPRPPRMPLPQSLPLVLAPRLFSI